MVLRNSVFSLIRTPVKTFLFLLLLTLLTALLGLGFAMQAGSQAMLEEADQTFTTVVQIDGPAQGVSDADLASLHQLAAHPAVLAVDREAQAGAWIDGVQVPFQEPALTHMGIMHFTVNHVLDSGEIIGIVKNVHFGRQLRPETVIGISTVDLDGQPLPVAWKEGHHYLALGYVFPTQTPMLLFTPAANLSDTPLQAPDVDLALLPAVMDITDQPEGPYPDPGRVLLEMSQVSQVLDQSFTVTLTSAVAITSPFYERETYLTGGRFFSPSESNSGAEVCLISDRLAELLGRTVGDSVILNLHGGADAATDQAYWPGQPGGDFMHQAAFEIVGTFKDVQTQQYLIYVPMADWAGQPNRSGQLARLRITNDQAQRFLADADQILPEHFSLSLSDQGYTDAVKPILAMQAMAWRLAAGTLAAALLTLLLFVHLSISKQADSARIMLALGSGKLRTGASLALNCLLPGVLAALLGAAAGAVAAEQITARVWQSLQQSQATDLRFSIRKLEPLVSFSAELPASHLQPWLAGALMLTLVLLLVLFAAGRQVLRQARAPGIPDGETKRKPHTTSRQSARASTLTIRPLALRFALLAIRRRPVRSLIIPAVCLTLCVLVVLLGQTQVQQARQLDSVYERIPVRAWFAPYKGLRNYDFGLELSRDVNDVFYGQPDRPMHSRDLNPLRLEIQRLTPEEAQAERDQMLSATPDIRDRALSYRCHYDLVGKAAHADLTPVDPAPPLYPDIQPHKNAFGHDWFVQKVLAFDDLIFAEDLSLTPAFLQQAPNVDFLDGYGSQSLKQAEPICVMPEDLMQAQGCGLGDTIRLTAYLVLDESNVLADVWDLRIVGSYQRQAGPATVYLPWLLLFDNEFIPDGVFQAMSEQDRYQPVPIEPVIPGEFLAESVYCCVLTLDQTWDLTALRDRLESLDFTESGKLGGRRIAVVIDDKELTETVQALTRQLRLMERVIPGILFLTVIIGFVVSWLLSRHRVREYALLRSLGTGKRAAFLAFFLEQVLLFGIGLLPVLVWLGSSGQLLSPAAVLVGLFALCYGLGLVLSICLLSRHSVLDVLLDPS